MYDRPVLYFENQLIFFFICDEGNIWFFYRRFRQCLLFRVMCSHLCNVDGYTFGIKHFKNLHQASKGG